MCLLPTPLIDAFLGAIPPQVDAAHQTLHTCVKFCGMSGLGFERDAALACLGLLRAQRYPHMAKGRNPSYEELRTTSQSPEVGPRMGDLHMKAPVVCKHRSSRHHGVRCPGTHHVNCHVRNGTPCAPPMTPLAHEATPRCPNIALPFSNNENSVWTGGGRVVGMWDKMDDVGGCEGRRGRLPSGTTPPRMQGSSWRDVGFGIFVRPTRAF